MKFSDTNYGDISQEIFNGEIIVAKLGLTSLEGSPKEINGNFFCGSNNLTSLKGRPQIVNGSFLCNNNELTSLEGRPKIIKSVFSCTDIEFFKNVNVRELVIKEQILAEDYWFTYDKFSFKDIKSDFNKYKRKLKEEKLNEELKNKKDKKYKKLKEEKLKNLKKVFSNTDYGISL